MNSSRKPPPPVIDSARVLSYAFTDSDDIEFTDRINLYVSDEGRLGRVPCLAISLNYCVPGDVLLEFCDSDWEVKGVIAFTSVEEAKIKAERGYRGISKRWIESPYSDIEVADFLRDVYEVDPKSEWWKTICSFCGKDVEEGQVVVGARATICEKCVNEIHESLQEGDDT